MAGQQAKIEGAALGNFMYSFPKFGCKEYRNPGMPSVRMMESGLFKLMK